MEEWLDDQDIFGFKIFGESFNEDFFLESPDELDEWLEALMKTMICADIEADYDFQRTIAHGVDSKISNALLLSDEELYAVKSIFKSKLIEDPSKLKN